MEEKIRAARMKATLLYPYLTTALLSITMHESNEVPTMAVTMSGKLMWNPDFIAKLSINEIAAVLVHEIWHLLRMHGERAPADENMHGVWNIACDCLLPGSLINTPFGYCPIEKIRPGDLILGYANSVVPSTVIAVHVKRTNTKPAVEVTCDSDTIYTTYDHKFATENGYERIWSQKSSAKVLRLRESLYLRTPQTVYCSRDGSFAWKTFSKHPVVHEITWYLRNASNGKTEELLHIYDPSRERDSLPCGTNRWRRDDNNRSKVQFKERENLLPATDLYIQHEYRSGHLAKGTSVQCGTCGKCKPRTMLENVSRRDRTAKCYHKKNRAISCCEEEAQFATERMDRLAFITAAKGQAEPSYATNLQGDPGAEYKSAVGKEVSTPAEVVFDIETTTGNFFANGFLVHNCAINDSLSGLPQDCVYPSTFRMEDHLTEEEYYEQLLKLPRIEVFIKGVGSGDCGSGARGGDKESGPLTKLDKTLIAKYTAEQIKACGNVPYDVARWAESVLNPKIPWDRELRSRFLSSAARAIGKTDFTYSKGSRRAACTKAILPGMVSYKPKVALIIDTSGSMSEKELSMCLAEVKGLLRALASRVTVYVADATVHSKNSVASIGEIKLMGGGGTDMGFAIREADKDRPDIIVVLSDFYTPWGDKPRAEVIGVCIGGSIEGAPSWMKAIKVE